MDTSEHVPAPTAPQTTPRTHDRPSRLGRVVLAGALAGPVVHLVGSALQPAALDAVGPGDYAAALDVMRDARDQTIAWRLVSGLGSLLFVLLAGPLVALVPRGARGAVLLRVALVPLVVGATGNAGYQTAQALVTAGATHPDVTPEAGLAVWEHLDTGVTDVLFGYHVLLALAVGLLVVAVALLRSGTVGRVAPVVMAVSLVGAFLVPAGLLTGLLLVPFAAAVAAVLLRSPSRARALVGQQR
ncbi:hypothetical protein FHN55_06540 [Streptomyces sp. NP160]|uniref:hypothetical protein n=1 Tax=Streptomyces sp. NP160 TaxID=2586637 RepID=UPI00111905A3|nr:hypothetical protein [Streptomyces sp. NP160]TNM68460.1 hypothetical protein FHN55_06540 [Streptomyces sp. NP160]